MGTSQYVTESDHNGELKLDYLLFLSLAWPAVGSVLLE